MRQNLAQFSAGSAAVIATLVVVHVSASLTAQAESFDNRWTAVEPLKKGDRLGLPANAGSSSVIFYNDPATAMTVVRKVQGARSDSSPAIRQTPQAPSENARQERPKKLPVGCEPSFSPVTTPSMAHVTGRCLAAYEGTKFAELSR